MGYRGHFPSENKAKPVPPVSRGLFHGLVFGDCDLGPSSEATFGLQGLSEPGARGWRWAAPSRQHPLPLGRQVRGGLQGEEQGCLLGLSNAPRKHGKNRLVWRERQEDVRDLGALSGKRSL